MDDWKETLNLMRKDLAPSSNALVIKIPNHFIFKNHGVYIFDEIVNFFDWSISDKQVVIDFTECMTANYQALSLIVLYCWRLKYQGCRISFELSEEGASNIWRRMGATGLFHVSTDDKSNFRHNDFKPWKSGVRKVG